MASQLANSRIVATAPPTMAERFVHLCVRRRVPITVGLLVVLLWLDGWVFHGRPRDVLNWTDPFSVAGVLLVLCGLLVRAWAAGTLRKQKQLATSGPYAAIRHPLYFGSFLMMAGFAALGFDPKSLAIVAPPLLWLYWQAIQSEERHVARLFPVEWPSYAATVPRLIPRRFVWPRFADWSFAQWRRNSEYQAWIGCAIGLACIKLWQIVK